MKSRKTITRLADSSTSRQADKAKQALDNRMRKTNPISSRISGMHGYQRHYETAAASRMHSVHLPRASCNSHEQGLCGRESLGHKSDKEHALRARGGTTQGEKLTRIRCKKRQESMYTQG